MHLLIRNMPDGLVTWIPPTRGSSNATWTTVPEEIPIEVTLLSLIFILGVLGNLLLLAATIKTSQLQKPIHIILANVMFCDLIICLILIPSSIYGTAVGEWKLPTTLCKIIAVTQFYLFATPLILNVLVSINCFLGCFPTSKCCRWLSSRRSTIVSLVVTWLYPAAVISLVFLGHYQMNFILPFANCRIRIPLESRKPYILAFGALLVYIPVTVIGSLYAAIVIRLARQQGNFTTVQKKITFIKRTRVMALLFAIVLVCWMPHITQSAYLDPTLSSPVWLTRLLLNFMFLNSAIQPFICLWRIKAYRIGVDRLFSVHKNTTAIGHRLSTRRRKQQQTSGLSDS